MAPPAGPADRYEPLPGLFGLPAHLLRKLSTRGRRLVLGLCALVLAGLIVTAIVLGPQIAESNRERTAQERQQAREAEARRLARLRAEQRPRTGTATSVAGVEEAITRDARARVATGELNTRALRTDCRTLGRRGGRLLLGCTAVTSDIEATEDVTGVLIGYPYRAAFSPDTGRYALCKTSGRPGEGSLELKSPVELPEVCGG